MLGGLWTKGFIGLAIVGIITAGSMHYKGIVKDLQNEKVKSSNLQIALDNQKLATEDALKAAKAWDTHLEKFEGQLDALAKIRKDARKDQNDLKEILKPGRLENLASKKPKLVQRIANNGTERSRILLECATESGGCSSGETSTSAGDDEAPSP